MVLEGAHGRQYTAAPEGHDTEIATTIAKTHLDDGSRLWSNDVIGHGTHVSGIIAAKKNGIGIVGVAPGVRLAAMKVAIDDVNDRNFGLVFPDAVVCGIDWAVAQA